MVIRMAGKKATREKPSCKTLWRFVNPSAGYVLKLIQIRWSLHKSPSQAHLVRYDLRGGKTTAFSRLCFFEGANESKRALRILRYLERTCRSVLPKLDAQFWTIFTQTVRYSPASFRFLNKEIGRCKCLA